MDKTERTFEILEQLRALGELAEQNFGFRAALNPAEPVTMIQFGGGELGTLVVMAAQMLGGRWAGIRTVVVDKYDGCPASRFADHAEVVDMLDGPSVEKVVKKHVPDPKQPHVMWAEVEKVHLPTLQKLGEQGYVIAPNSLGPSIGMDRVNTKALLRKSRVTHAPWDFAYNSEEAKKVTQDIGLPVIMKPVMTSSGHGTTIINKFEEVEAAYEFSKHHARGRGDIVTVEKFMPELRKNGTELTQLTTRGFNDEGKWTTIMATVEHQRPGAVYHESWQPVTVKPAMLKKGIEDAKKIADFIRGPGIFAVEQFVLGNKVYTNEFTATRPHDTGLVTLWGQSLSEGEMHLRAVLGLPMVEPKLKPHFTAAHVILAPENMEGTKAVSGYDMKSLDGHIRRGKLKGTYWLFGKPDAYGGRRMGVAIGYGENLKGARKTAADIAHAAENCIVYGGTA